MGESGVLSRHQLHHGGFRSFSPSSTTTSPPPPSLSSSPSTPPFSPINTVMSPSPLLRDVGSINSTSTPSEARLQSQLPLPSFEGCGWVSVVFGRNREWRRREKGNTGKGRPIWCITKHEPRHLSWFVFAICLSIPLTHALHPPSLMTTASTNTILPWTTTMIIDDNDEESECVRD